MAVHQLVPNFVFGDATGQAALHLQWLLRRLGHAGQLFSGETPAELSPLVRPVEELRPRRDDWVLYHHGIASALSGHFLHLPCHRGVVFHNITPARFQSEGALKEALEAGRAQLAALAPHSELSIGVSRFNAQELKEAGHRNVQVVPLFIEPERFAAHHADFRLQAELASGGEPVLLSVGRVTPHKRVEDIIALHAEVRRWTPAARLLIVGGYAEGSAYFRKLRQRAHDVGNVRFLGRLTHSELVAAYRSATVFISMSEHEGFGVPFMEAMACDVPVLGFSAAAVEETLGGAGIVFTEKRFALLAELVRELHQDGSLRQNLLEGQKRRLKALSPEAAAASLQKALGTRVRAAPRLRVSSSRPRVGIIVQRYSEASGGAERHAREIAHRLSADCDVTVLTSCSDNHLTWNNTHPEGLSQDGPVKVHRFASSFPRQTLALNRLSRRLFREPSDRLTEELWLSLQGPELPGLMRHLVEARERYSAFIAFTYLYAPTARAVGLLGNQCLVVPTAHDEPAFRLGVFRDVFERPSALLCNTEEEAELIERTWPNAARRVIAGVGVDAPRTQPDRFLKRYGKGRPYLLYVGRIEHDKGIPELLRHHQRMTRAQPDMPELLLAGDARLRRLVGPGTRYLGRISDEEKWDGLAGAVAAVVPSQFESLSLLALEAFACGTPVIANGRSEVLKGHAERGGATLLFTNQADYARAVAQAVKERAVLSRRARAYAKRFQWTRVMDIYQRELSKIPGAPIAATSRAE